MLRINFSDHVQQRLNFLYTLQTNQITYLLCIHSLSITSQNLSFFHKRQDSISNSTVVYASSFLTLASEYLITHQCTVFTKPFPAIKSWSSKTTKSTSSATGLIYKLDYILPRFHNCIHIYTYLWVNTAACWESFGCKSRDRWSRIKI